jgi:tetratricopeptide (TPR) repeat protein
MEDAIVAAYSAVHANPASAWAYVLVGDAQLDAWQSDNALFSYQKAVELEPGNVSALLALGWLTQLMGNEEEALAAYDKALAYEPGNPDAHIAMGDAYLALGDRANAIAEYQVAADLDSSQLLGYLALGDQYEINGEVDLAENAYRQAIAASPGSVVGHIALGHLLQQQERYAEAQEQYEAAVAVDRSMAWPLLMEGNLHQILEDSEAAKAAYEAAIAAQPGDVNAYSNLADLLLIEEDNDGATAVLTRAMEIQPGSGLVWRMMGLTDVRRGMPGEALDSFEQALLRDPGLSDLYASVARIYEKWNQPWPTAVHFEHLSEENPDVPWYAAMTGHMYKDLDALPAAMEHYTKLLGLVPDYADVHYNLALIYERVGQARSAMTHWNVYMALAAGSQYAPEAQTHRHALRQVVITSPGDEQELVGSVEITGTVLHDELWYYKVEYLDPELDSWQVIGELHTESVTEGLLEIWNTDGLASGTYWLRLVAVEVSGQFAPPYALQVRIVGESDE